MGDDGVGLAALALLQESWAVPAEVVLVDGGTWGMNLLPVIEDAGRVLLLDAIDADGPPGTLVRIPRERLPRYLSTKISPHQVDLRDVLALAELRRTLPDDTIAIGLQAARVEFGESLSPAVRAGLNLLVEAVVEELEARGHSCVPRVAPTHA